MDYCTWFPEGWWSHCCAAHDADYAAQVARALADERLYLCVAASVDQPPALCLAVLVAMAMWCGVRLFGRRFYRPTQP